MMIAAAIVVVQIPLGAPWLSRFRFGPVEWSWRRLTCGREFQVGHPDGTTIRFTLG